MYVREAYPKGTLFLREALRVVGAGTLEGFLGWL